MKYDFDAILDRRNTNSVKYDFAGEYGVPEGALPMWVADMDFPAPPEVVSAVQKAAAHGIFGYTEVKDDYYTAVSGWFSSRFGYSVTSEEIIKTPGVVFALAQIVRTFTNPAETVLIQTPVYYPFYRVVNNNGRQLAINPLQYKDGKYYIDFEDFELKIQTKQVKLFLLCSPHNPVGRVWTKSELERVNEICRKWGVMVVSDEIHCDFVWPGNTHTCFGLIDNEAIIATAPSKSFNLAGLQASNIFVKNTTQRVRLKKEIISSGYSHLNTLGLIACQNAYTHGGEWLAQLQDYLVGNISLTREFIAERLPQIRLVAPEGTYLLWLDFSAYNEPQSELDRRLTEGAGVWLDSGTMFGPEGKGFQRINIACPRDILMEALRRIEKEFKE